MKTSKEGRYYVVKKGDSLWGIAKHFGYGVEQLASYNSLNGKQKRLIQIGQIIYLPDGKTDPDLKLGIKVIGLSGKPVKNAKLKVTHDGKESELKTDATGWLYGLNIQDHVKGLKIEFENYEGKWQKILDEKILPLGEKSLHINILTDLLKGRTFRKDGSELVPDKKVPLDVKSQTSQPASTSHPDKPLPDVPAMPAVKETRTTNGVPTTVSAPLFASENLYLEKGNEKFRQVIIDAAKRYQLTPHSLAAIVNAEVITKKGVWVETSASSGSNARGLGQFLPPAWFQYVAKPGTLGHKAALKYTGTTQLLAANGRLYKVEGKEKSEIRGAIENTILGWRDHGEYSIDAIGAYAEDNLKYLKDNGIDATSLTPDEKVKIAYIMHHEGPRNGVLYLSGELGKTKKSDAESVAKTLAKQFQRKDKSGTIIDDGTESAKALANRFGGDYVKAYYYFLANHTNAKVNVKNFMIKHDGFKERSAYEVIKSVSGVSVNLPNEKQSIPADSPTSKAVSSNKSREVRPDDGVGGSAAWSDPLDSCTIRIGGYADSESNPKSARSKSLFGGRSGKHKGIDLDALPGTLVKAVANGRVAYANLAGSYGNVILLAVDVNDLPPRQRTQARQIMGLEDDLIYFLYAHLSESYVTPKKDVQAGHVIGKTGDSGNAKGMTLVGHFSKGKDASKLYGAHLHFEARLNSSLKKGQGKWADPLPFLTHYA